MQSYDITECNFPLGEKMLSPKKMRIDIMDYTPNNFIESTSNSDSSSKFIMAVATVRP